jgi:hypothetical protein
MVFLPLAIVTISARASILGDKILLTIARRREFVGAVVGKVILVPLILL